MSRPSTVTAALAVLLVLGCAGQPGEGDSGADTVGADTLAAGDTAVADTAAPVRDTLGHGAVSGDTAAAADSPAGAGPRPVADTAEGTRARGDTAWARIARGRPDSAVAGRFFVRLLPTADPRAVAERHRVEPDDVLTDRVRAFYAELTWGQVGSLARDTLVRSLAQQIEGSDTTRPPLRGLPVSDTGGR